MSLKPKSADFTASLAPASLPTWTGGAAKKISQILHYHFILFLCSWKQNVCSKHHLGHRYTEIFGVPCFQFNILFERCDLQLHPVRDTGPVNYKERKYNKCWTDNEKSCLCKLERFFKVLLRSFKQESIQKSHNLNPLIFYLLLPWP